MLTNTNHDFFNLSRQGWCSFFGLGQSDSLIARVTGSETYIIRLNMSWLVADLLNLRENLVLETFSGRLLDSRGVSEVSPREILHDLD